MMKTNAPSVRRVARGFTLIEILVVVAIIALLISILLPSLSKARELARGVACGTHMNQVFKGILFYTQQHADRLPNFGYNTDVEWWPAQIARHVSYQFALYACPSDLKPNLHYLRVRQGHASMVTAPGPGIVPVEISYSGSCDAIDQGKFNDIVGRPITSYKRPSTSILLIEAIDPNSSVGGNTGGCFRFNRLIDSADPRKKSSRTYPFDPSFLRHNGRSNVLFVDSHVERATPLQIADKLAYQQEFYDVSPKRK
jgi:prepilin-type N-terminal cleavage/methylation domain-containing protein/prepilin-type processing-associated H-X9-DG protein